MNVQIIDTDVLIIGSGIAGLRAALGVKKSGKQPVLVSKSPLGKANNTALSGGGFTFATKTFGQAEHFQETLNSGRMLNDRALVEYLVSTAPGKVQELLEMGIEGNSVATGFHCQSPFLIGGPKITQVLCRACRAAEIRIFENIMITDLIVADERCRGALGFQRQSGQWYGFCAKATVLATGGAGAIYGRSDNAPGATGDGYALALNAGLELMDMEFVQFYPLAYVGTGYTNMIVMPFFADLGKILNRHGEDIKEKYQLHEKPVAIIARDRLSQALFLEIDQGNDIDGALYLDLRHIDETLLPCSDEEKARYRHKMSYDKVPVKITPACHHTMGGIPIDVKGQTALNGLYAAGEVVGGIHGANRMGGNALSEGLVFGELAGRAASEATGSSGDLKEFAALMNVLTQKWIRFLNPVHATPSPVRDVRRPLKETLWEKVGIVRDEASLKEGIERIKSISSTLEAMVVSKPRELSKIVECRNAVSIGMSIAISALERKESRGSHSRKDYPAEEKEWTKNILVGMADETTFFSRIKTIIS
ncbi:conserved hypothetical protein [uncultured Desulfobacterium sp.]|uniref:L-aspartate oxidase n=1 Tax=uncultured Desulfobacterium sp. TaxID=201089 RepID=A0A445N1C3_9BACT|nr:conserved hypothetical protein [uncultured Desulfobacterium sp.]